MFLLPTSSLSLIEKLFVFQLALISLKSSLSSNQLSSPHWKALCLPTSSHLLIEKLSAFQPALISSLKSSLPSNQLSFPYWKALPSYQLSFPHWKALPSYQLSFPHWKALCLPTSSHPFIEKLSAFQPALIPSWAEINSAVKGFYLFIFIKNA